MNKTTRVTLISSLALAAFAGAFLVATIYHGGYRRFVMGNTSCMSPTISSGELIFARPFEPTRDKLRRYQIVVFWSPVSPVPGEKWVMRVVGLPGEQVEVGTNSLLINGSEIEENHMPAALRKKQWLNAQMFQPPGQCKWTLRSDEVFVVGDNLSTAHDSRLWGPLNLANVVGLVERTAKGKKSEPHTPTKARSVPRK